MDEVLKGLAGDQEDLVAAWQLRASAWSWRRIRHHIAADGWRRVHQGVYSLSQSALTRRQLWIAATLTAPSTFLSHASGGACWGFRPFEGGYETVTRSGNGGPRRFGGVLVSRSGTLAGNTVVRDGIPITSAERTLIDLAPHCTDRQRGRIVREAIRLKLTAAKQLGAVVDAHPNVGGTGVLRELSRLYANLPIARTREDSEALALQLLFEAGVELPRVNVRIAKQEADLVWDRERLIIEIDGPQFHRFRDEDLRKQGVWERAGYRVRRVSSDDVYDRPGYFIAVVRSELADRA